MFYGFRCKRIIENGIKSIIPSYLIIEANAIIQKLQYTKLIFLLKKRKTEIVIRQM